VLSPMGTAQTAVMVAALEPAACEIRGKGPRLLWRSLTALGGALDLDCCAVDQDFGDALHQLV
jgi:hypothetical protein